MRTVLLCDDDRSFLLQIRSMMDWNAAGYVILDTAYNGLEAAAKVRELHPDIVITDMDMPASDGIALIRQLREGGCEAEIIALSAYADYHYIRTSMKEGAYDYLLKSELTAQRLLEILGQVSERLNSRRRNEQEFPLGGRERNRQAFQLALQGLAGKEDLPYANFHLVLVSIDDFGRFAGGNPDNRPVILRSCQEILNDTVRDEPDVSGLSVCLYDGLYSVLIDFGAIHSQMFMIQKVSGMVKRIQDSFHRDLNLTASIYVSPWCSGSEEIASRFLAGRDIILSQSLRPGSIHYACGQALSPEPALEKWSGLQREEEESLQKRFFALDREGMFRELETILHRISHQRISHKSIYLLYIELCNLTRDVMEEYGLEEREVWKGEDPYRLLQSLASVQELNEWITGIFGRVFDLCQGAVYGGGSSLPVRRAISYIHTHYTLDVVQTEVAEQVGISSSYLSRLFKQELGLGFTEYLNQVRVRQACRMLREGRKSPKAVYRDCGFQSYTYFFKVFKRVAGMTPVEYLQEKTKYGSRFKND